MEFIHESQKFRVQVKTEFDFSQSNPLQFQYLFSYKILITNLSEKAATLQSRFWNIKDAHGKLNFVEGPGVIGLTPHFDPGQSFEYQSFCPLPTMSGEMWGHFKMVDEEGHQFKIDTPLFKFQVPQEFIDQY